jgi:hypothetical protein
MKPRKLLHLLSDKYFAVHAAAFRWPDTDFFS